MIEIAPFWNQIQKRPDLLMHASIYHWAAKIFQPGWVMDLGSEMGIGGGLMESVNGDVVVIDYDINQVSLKLSTEYSNKVTNHRIQGDGAFLPMGPNKLSGICLVNTLHLVEDPGQILNECYRVLKPSGQAVISIPTRQIPNRWHIKKLTMNICDLVEELFSDFQVPDHINNKLIGQRWEVGLDTEYYIIICTK